jgi:hypothetical protein
MQKFALLVGAAMVVAVAVAAAISTPASAAAGVTRQTITNPISETGITDPCLPGETGTLAGTAVVTFQTVETGGNVHVTGTEVDSGRIDWSNGDYTTIGSTDHFSFTGTAQGTFVNTNAHVDFGDFYSAEGVFLFRETFHIAEHFTVTNGDVTRVEFVRGHLHFFGGCGA